MWFTYANCLSRTQDFRKLQETAALDVRSLQKRHSGREPGVVCRDQAVPSCDKTRGAKIGQCWAFLDWNVGTSWLEFSGYSFHRSILKCNPQTNYQLVFFAVVPVVTFRNLLARTWFPRKYRWDDVPQILFIKHNNIYIHIIVYVFYIHQKCQASLLTTAGSKRGHGSHLKWDPQT